MKPSPSAERIFLSCASAEFAPERLRLANHLRALISPRFEVTVQEDLQQGGHTLLERLADYIRNCDLVIHIVGDVCGARPSSAHVAALYQRLGEALPQPLPEYSYTQWEYRLARKFDKRVLVYLASPEARRQGSDGSPPPAQSDDDVRRQQAHVQDIRQSGEHRSGFANTAQLIQHVLHDLSRDGEPPHKASNIVFKSLGALFKGRDDFLAQIRASLGEAQHRGVLRAAAITATATAATVHGLGGIGKTRAAIEYAHRYGDDYTALLLVRADSPEKLNDNLAELCGSMVLDLPEQQIPDAEAKVAAALRWLRQHPGWFLIIDNVDTEAAAAAVESLLARLQDSGQVLITSRLGNWSAAVSTLQLDVLTRDDSTALLLQRTDPKRLKRPDDATQAGALAEALGQLPLALEQAGARIEKEHLSFEQYLAQWADNRDKVMQWFDPRLMQYPASVAVTWLTTVDKLDEPARMLLRTLAWLAPDPVPRIVFADQSDTLAELAAYSLVTWNVEGGFSVHRLVQEVTRSRMDEAAQRKSLVAAVARLSDAFIGDTDDPSCWPLMASLAPHGWAVIEAGSQSAAIQAEPQPGTVGALKRSLEILSKGAFALRVGDFFRATGRFPLAIELQRYALAVHQSALSDENPDTLAAMTNLANSLRAQGDSTGARKLQEQVLEVRRRVLGEAHRDTLSSMSNLASTLHDQGDLPGARKLKAQALEGLRQVLGEEHPDTLVVMSNYAVTLGEQGDLPGARKLAEQVLEVRRRVLGEEHPDTLSSMNNLALILRDQGDLPGARKLQEQVLQGRRQALGEEHPDTLASMSNLAGTLGIQGDWPESRRLKEQALEGLRRVLGEEHPVTLIAMSGLVNALANQSELPAAHEIQEQVVEVRRRVLGEEHPDTLSSMNNLALIMHDQGDLPGARKLQEQVLQGRRRVLGEEHPDTLASRRNLAHTLEKQGALPGARKLQEDAHEVRRQAPGQEYLNSAEQHLAKFRNLERIGKTYAPVTSTVVGLLAFVFFPSTGKLGEYSVIAAGFVGLAVYFAFLMVLRVQMTQWEREAERIKSELRDSQK